MEFQEILSRFPTSCVSDEGIALWKINTEIREEDRVPEINIHSILFVVQGRMEISVQGKPYTLTRGYFADILEGKSIRLLSATADAQAYLLLLTECYLSKLFKKEPPFPISYTMDIMQNPVYAIEASSVPPIIKNFDDVEQVLRHPLHYYQKEMLKCRMWTLLLQMCEAVLQKAQKEETKTKEVSDRRKVQFKQFMALLREHVEQEHTVNFYADRMNVTPQYLRRIVKEYSGKAVSSWISEELSRKIINLLSTTDLPIQEIADRLHFSDQAVLTKFFKRTQGVSPLKYRNENENG